MFGFDGRIIKVNREDWIVIKDIGFGLFLAIRSGDDGLPKQVYLIREE